MDPSRQRQLELIAQAEMEMAQQQPAPSYQPPQPDTIGPDYNQGIFANSLRGAVQAPRAGINMVGEGYMFATDPLGTVQRAGAEKSLNTVGSLAAGTAGAGVGASYGAMLGAPILPPFGSIAGGILGGAGGFGMGLLGYNVTKDAALGETKPLEQYLTDLAYNIPQAAVLGGITEGAVNIPKVKSVASGFTKAGNEARVAGDLNKMSPDYAARYDQALAEAQAAGIPPELMANRSLGEMINDPALKNQQRVMAMSGSEQYGKSYQANQARNDAQLKYLDQIEQSQVTPADAQATIQSSVASDLGAQRSAIEADIAAKQAAADAQARELQSQLEVDLAAKAAATESGISGLQSQTEAAIAAKKQAAEQLIAERKAALEQAQAGVEAATGSLPPQIDLAAGGAQVRSGIKEKLANTRESVSAGFEGAGTGIVDRTPVVETAQAIMPQYFKEVGAQASDGLRKLYDQITKEGEPIVGANGKPFIDPSTGQPMVKEPTYTMQDMQAMRSAAIKIAKGSDRRSAAVANSIIDSIDTAVNAAIDSSQAALSKIAADAEAALAKAPAPYQGKLIVPEAPRITPDEAVATALKSGKYVTPDQAQSWRNAIAERNKQGRVFENKGLPTKSVLATEYSGAPTLPDSAVLGKFFHRNKGARESVQNYKDAYGSTPEALDPLYRYAADSFRREAMDGNLVNTRRARQWIQQHAEALKDLPDLQEVFASPERAQTFMNEKLGELKAAESTTAKEVAAFEKQKTAELTSTTKQLTKEQAAFEKQRNKETAARIAQTTREIEAYKKQKAAEINQAQADIEKGALKLWLKGVDPDVAISEMLSGKDAIRKTKATVDYLKSKDPTAVAGLRRGVIDYFKRKVFEANGSVSIEEASVPGGPTFNGLTRDAMVGKVWNSIRPAIERSKLFTESQMKSFDFLYKDKASQVSVRNAKYPGDSGTLGNQSTLNRMLQAAGSGFLKKSFGPYWGMIEPVLAAIPRAKYMAIMEEALLNPKYARDLWNKATPKNMIRTAEQIFKNDLAKVFGNTTPWQATKTAAGIAAPYAPILANEPNQKRPVAPPKQSAVLAKKSYPTPDELLRPPAAGKIQGPFDAKAYAKSLTAQQGPETKARINVESSQNPYALSPKGAQGLAQLMPSTAQDIAKALGETYMPLRPGMTPEQQRAAIDQNVRFGDYYLNTMLPKIDKSFKNKSLAWAAYNAGPGAVQDAMMMAGTTRDVNKILAQLPDETQNYVKKLTRTYGQG